jgi:hypothetical protein
MEATTDFFLEHALRYVAAGVPVFPLQPREKKPLAKSHGFKDATTESYAVIDAWTTTPDANIGIPTGVKIGDAELLVIDFDEERFYEAWCAEVGNSSIEGDWIIQRTGNGLQIIFACPDAGTNRKLAYVADETSKTGRSIAIETRGRGGYIVAAPSIHPNGNSYEIVYGDMTAIPVLDQATADTLLELAENLCEAPLSKLEQAKFEIATPRTTSYRANGSTSVIDKFNEAYDVVELLETCGYERRGKRLIRPNYDKDSEPGVIVGERDGKKVTFHFSSNDDLCDGHTHDAFSVFCKLQHGGDAREAVRIAAARLGLQLDPIPDRTSEGELEILPGGNLEAAAKDFSASLGGAAPCVAAPAEIAEIAHEISVEDFSASLEAPTAQFPATLLHPPGLVGEIVGWINRTARKPQPVFALGNALAFCGALFGRKVRTKSNARTNVYILGAGGTCCGKDHSRQMIKDLAFAAGIAGEILGGEEVSSDSAIQQAVHEHPSILFQWDEIGQMFAATSSKYAASHQRAIVPMLMKFFSSAGGVYLGKEYANRKENERKDVIQPNVCIYGTTVADRLFEGLTPAEIGDGFLGRLLVLNSDDDNPRRRKDATPEDPPEALIEHVRAWWRRDDLPKAKGNIAALLTPVPHLLEALPEATEVFDAFEERCRGYQEEHRHHGLAALWGRGLEHALKVALIVAASRSYVPELSTDILPAWRPMGIMFEDAQFAVALVEHSISQLINGCRYGVASTDYERNLLHVLNLIRGAGVRGVTRSQLCTRARKISTRARNEIVDHLVESGQVITKQAKGAKGPAATIYVHGVNK